MKFAIPSLVLLLSTSTLSSANAIQQRDLLDDATSVLGGAFDTATSVLAQGATSFVPSVFSEATSAAGGAFDTATSVVNSLLRRRV